MNNTVYTPEEIIMMHEAGVAINVYVQVMHDTSGTTELTVEIDDTIQDSDGDGGLHQFLLVTERQARIHAEPNKTDDEALGYMRVNDKAQIGDVAFFGGKTFYEVVFGNIIGWVKWEPGKMEIAWE